MKAIPYDVGRVVLSKQGHDQGSWFMVLRSVDEKHVLIVDGRTRKLEKPKKKQTKHLRAKPVRLTEIAERLAAGQPVLDSHIRTALKALTDQEEQKVCQKKEECALVKE